MKNIIGSMLQKTDLNHKLNVLTHCCHESYQFSMRNVNANFYMYRGPGMKDWNHKFRDIPKNHFLLPYNETNNPAFTLPKHINLDLILCQTEAGSVWPISKHLSSLFQIPIQCHTHTTPINLPQEYIEGLKEEFKHVAVRSFISKNSREAWGYSRSSEHTPGWLVRHGIDSGFFNIYYANKNPVILSIVNEWESRGHILGLDIWKEITKGLPTKVLGDNPGWTKPAESMDALRRVYSSSLIFLNTSRFSPIPSVLLEAASSGCIVVSTETCAIPEFFTNNVDILMSNSPQQLRFWLEDVLKTPDKYRHIGENARKLVIEKFNMADFTKRWDDLLSKTAQTPYRGEYHSG